MPEMPADSGKLARRMRRLLLLAVLATVIPAGSATATTWRAGSCASLDGTRIGVKPAALGRALLVTDSGALLTRSGTTTAPGPDAEWLLAHTHLRRATGCRQYPEASLGARGSSRRGKVWGLVDAHLHITADLRAGGQVISGT